MGVTNVAASPTSSERTAIPDPAPRKTDPHVGPAGFAPTSDLDGLYVWLGPTGAASRVDAVWDTTFGVQLAVVRVREGGAVGVLGAAAGATRWTERGGGRIWLDAVIGRRIGRMIGFTAGPILELSALAHPRLGGSIGVWGFAGITPFARLGMVQELGGFAEVGVHIALPVWRH